MSQSIIIYLVLLIIYIVIGVGTFNALRTIAIFAGLPKVKHMKIVTVCLWPVALIYMASS
jgi:hypothetical protein